MIFERFIAFVFVICMAGIVGYFASWGGHVWLSALLLMSLAASILYFLEVLRGLRFLKWLRSDDHAVDVFKAGFWEEASGLVRKLLKQKELSRLASEDSLRQFLAAIQASPNGVLLWIQSLAFNGATKRLPSFWGLTPSLICSS
jgi:two-component system phosphate regulon sensor histidine kinase PhoR